MEWLEVWHGRDEDIKANRIALCRGTDGKLFVQFSDEAGAKGTWDRVPEDHALAVAQDAKAHEATKQIEAVLGSGYESRSAREARVNLKLEAMGF